MVALAWLLPTDIRDMRIGTVRLCTSSYSNSDDSAGILDGVPWICVHLPFPNVPKIPRPEAKTSAVTLPKSRIDSAGSDGPAIRVASIVKNELTPPADMDVTFGS